MGYPYESAASSGFPHFHQVITLRLSVITSGSQPLLKLRWVGEEVQREDIAQEFKAVLQERIGSSASLYRGAFDPK